MTQNAPTYTTPTAAQFEALRARLGLSIEGLAAYLGTPVNTVRKWSKGTRAPGATVARLIEVLAMVETMAPALHAALIPGAPEHAERPARAPRRTMADQN
jgi:predicted transcriptional regulator